MPICPLLDELRLRIHHDVPQVYYFFYCRFSILFSTSANESMPPTCDTYLSRLSR